MGNTKNEFTLSLLASYSTGEAKMFEDYLFFDDWPEYKSQKRKTFDEARQLAFDQAEGLSKSPMFVLVTWKWDDWDRNIGEELIAVYYNGYQLMDK